MLFPFVRLSFIQAICIDLPEFDSTFSTGNIVLDFGFEEIVKHFTFGILLWNFLFDFLF